MAKILLSKDDNLKQEVEIIRYFKYKNDYYLIYTLYEFDEKNYQKLYIVKVLKELDDYIGYDINDKNEWKRMQSIIKKVIKEIKSGKKKDINDLDYNCISGIKISEPRSFKLDKNLVNILSSNYEYSLLDDNIENQNIGIIEQEGNAIGQSNIQTLSSSSVEPLEDYQSMYYSLREEKVASDAVIEKLVNDLVKYKEKFGEIE